MAVARPLLSVDFLVFSSHKTATQTLIGSLNASGASAMHAHTLPDIELAPGEFPDYLRSYRAETGRPLRVVSVFRDPFDRLVSSFFQSLEEEYNAWTIDGSELYDDLDAAVTDRTDEDLLALFRDYISKINGFGESIGLIADELSVSVSALSYDGEATIGINHLPNCELIIFRFDKMVMDLEGSLRRLLGRAPVLISTNVSASKPYGRRLAEFVSWLRLPEAILREIYYERRALMHLFYPGQTELILQQRIERFAE